MLLKLKNNPESLAKTTALIDHIRRIAKQIAHYNPNEAAHISADLDQHLLPQKECSVCCEPYNNKDRICEQFPCCENLACSLCLHAQFIKGMSYETHDNRGRPLIDASGKPENTQISKRCPFCSKFVSEMASFWELLNTVKKRCAGCLKKIDTQKDSTKSCSKCGVTFYCSDVCKNTHNSHKDGHAKYCKAIKANVEKITQKRLVEQSKIEEEFQKRQAAVKQEEAARAQERKQEIIRQFIELRKKEEAEKREKEEAQKKKNG